jgi:hypothetical protein
VAALRLLVAQELAAKEVLETVELAARLVEAVAVAVWVEQEAVVLAEALRLLVEAHTVRVAMEATTVLPFLQQVQVQTPQAAVMAAGRVVVVR